LGSAVTAFCRLESGLADLLGYSEEEFESLDWRKLLAPEEIRLAERAIQSGSEMKNVLWHWCKKGGRQIAVTIATRRTILVDNDNNLREISIGLVVSVGNGEPIPAYAAF
jgi:hypothetical protein